jgi:hypothetical protein
MLLDVWRIPGRMNYSLYFLQGPGFDTWHCQQNQPKVKFLTFKVHCDPWVCLCLPIPGAQSSCGKLLKLKSQLVLLLFLFKLGYTGAELPSNFRRKPSQSGESLWEALCTPFFAEDSAHADPARDPL